MTIKRFSIVFGFIAAAASAAMAAPPRVDDAPISTAVADSDIVLVQGFKERKLEDMPAVDAGRVQPPTSRAAPPSPPLVPPAPRVTSRSAPPPTADDDSGPPAREVPPPPSSSSRYTPPPPPPTRAPTTLHEPAPTYRTAPPPRLEAPPPAAAAPRSAPPAYDDPPPPRRADAPRRPPRSAFYANCTQQCHLSCEATFEACNGDSSPAKPACVKKLESCRVERCSCRFD